MNIQQIKNAARQLVKVDPTDVMGAIQDLLQFVEIKRKSQEEVDKAVIAMVKLSGEKLQGLSDRSLESVIKIYSAKARERSFEQRVLDTLKAGTGLNDVAELGRAIEKGSAKKILKSLGSFIKRGGWVVNAFAALEEWDESPRNMTVHDFKVEQYLREKDKSYWPKHRKVIARSDAIHEASKQGVSPIVYDETFPYGIPRKWQPDQAWQRVQKILEHRKVIKLRESSEEQQKYRDIDLKKWDPSGAAAYSSTQPVSDILTSSMYEAQSGFAGLAQVGDESLATLTQRTVEWGEMTEDTMDAVSMQTYDLGEGVDLTFGQIGEGTSDLIDTTRAMSQNAVLDYTNLDTATTIWGDNTLLAFGGVIDEAGAVGGQISGLEGVFNDAMGSMGNIGDQMLSGFESTAQGVIKGLINGDINSLGDAWDTLAQGMEGVWKGALNNMLKQFSGWAANLVAGFAQAGLNDLFAGIFGGQGGNLSKFFGGGSGGGGIINKLLGKGVSKGLDYLVDSAGSIWDTVGGWFGDDTGASLVSDWDADVGDFWDFGGASQDLYQLGSGGEWGGVADWSWGMSDEMANDASLWDFSGPSGMSDYVDPNDFGSFDWSGLMGKAATSAAGSVGGMAGGALGAWLGGAVGGKTGRGIGNKAGSTAGKYGAKKLLSYATEQSAQQVSQQALNQATQKAAGDLAAVGTEIAAQAAGQAIVQAAGQSATAMAGSMGFAGAVEGATISAGAGASQLAAQSMFMGMGAMGPMAIGSAMAIAGQMIDSYNIFGIGSSPMSRDEAREGVDTTMKAISDFSSGEWWTQDGERGGRYSTAARGAANLVQKGPPVEGEYSIEEWQALIATIDELGWKFIESGQKANEFVQELYQVDLDSMFLMDPETNGETMESQRAYIDGLARMAEQYGLTGSAAEEFIAKMVLLDEQHDLAKQQIDYVETDWIEQEDAYIQEVLLMVEAADTLRQTVESISESMGLGVEQTQALTDATHALWEEMQTGAVSVEEVDQAIKDLAQDFGLGAKESEQLRQQLDDLANEALANTERGMYGLQHSVSDVNREFGAGTDVLGGFSTTLDGVNTFVGVLDGSLGGVNNSVNVLGTSLDNLPDDVDIEVGLHPREGRNRLGVSLQGPEIELGWMHDGGLVGEPERYHAGELVRSLAHDEVPIIAQRGEYVVRNSSVNAATLPTLRAINAGAAPPAAAGPNIVIQGPLVEVNGLSLDSPQVMEDVARTIEDQLRNLQNSRWAA